MGDYMGINVLLERAPIQAEVTAFVGHLRDTCTVPNQDMEFGGRINPAGQTDEEIAEKLLSGQHLDIGYGDTFSGFWLQPNGLPDYESDQCEEVRKLPHARFRMQDVYFYPDTDEDETAVVERHRDLVALVTHVYEGFAVHGPQPIYVYGPHPATEQQLWGDDSDMTLPISAVTEGVPPEVFWLQIYPPKMVEKLGEQTLLSAPAWHTERLDDGSVLVAVYETPSLYTNGGYAIEPVAEHIGIE